MRCFTRSLWFATSALLLASEATFASPVLQQRLSDPSADRGYFGSAIAVNTANTVAMISAPVDSFGGGAPQHQGEVFVYANTNGVWKPTQTLQPSLANYEQYFGSSIAISGNLAIIGAMTYAPSPSQPAVGRAYVFTYANGTWSETAILAASDASAYSRFGVAVAIDGTTAVIGTMRADGGVGSAYVFDRNVAGNWVQTQELFAPFPTPVDEYGWSVAISGDRIAVGQQQVNGQQPGQVSFYARSGGIWSFVNGLPGHGSEDFSKSISLSGTAVAIGAPAATSNGHATQGLVYIARFASGAWGLTQTLSLVPGAVGAQFGGAVALHGTGLAVGAQYMTGAGGMYGAAYYYHVSGASFVGPDAIFYPDGPVGTPGPRFGASIDFALTPGIGGGVATIFIGAPTWVDEHNAQLGLAYVYSN